MRDVGGWTRTAVTHRRMTMKGTLLEVVLLACGICQTVTLGPFGTCGSWRTYTWWAEETSAERFFSARRRATGGTRSGCVGASLPLPLFCLLAISGLRGRMRISLSIETYFNDRLTDSYRTRTDNSVCSRCYYLVALCSLIMYVLAYIEA